MTAPTITPERIRDCATIAARRESSRARRAARDVVAAAEARHAAAMAEQHAHKDHLPLFDVDWAAVYQLAHAQLDFSTHTGPAAPTDAEKVGTDEERRQERQRRSRLRATYDAERYLAVQALTAGGMGARTMAAHLGCSEKAIERWRARRAVGWPTGIDGDNVPRWVDVCRVQGVTDTREVADLAALAA